MAEQERNLEQQDNGGQDAGTDKQSETENKGTPTVEELLAQLATERANNAKNKAALDKALKDNGTLTKSLRAKQTAEEQEAEAKAEAERQRQEAEAEKDKKIAMYEARDRYRAMGLPNELVESAAEADVENDKDALAKIFAQHTAQLLKENDAKWMKQSPQPNAGGQYSSMTREQIMAITDSAEQRKAIAANMDLFR